MNPVRSYQYTGLNLKSIDRELRAELRGCVDPSDGPAPVLRSGKTHTRPAEHRVHEVILTS